MGFAMTRIRVSSAAGRRLAAFLLATSCAIFSPAMALAQQASQITPPSFTPVRQLPDGAVAVEAAPGLETPPGAETLFVTPADVVIEGGREELASASQALTALLAGRRIAVAELFEAARRIQSLYAQAGYVLARVTIPAQTLKDGTTARIVVLDGYIERIDTSAVPAAVRRRVDGLLTPLLRTPGLTLGEIERALLLAGDTPGTQLRSALGAGTEPGGTVLTIEALHQPVTGQVTLDNSLSRALGRVSAGVGVQLNSLAGLGEQLYVFASGYPHDNFTGATPRNRALAGGLIVPIGQDGLSLNVEAVNARAAPRVDAGFLQTASRFDRYAVRLRYPVIRRRNYTLNASAGFDWVRDRQDIIAPIDAPLSLDRLRVLRLEADGVWFLADGSIFSGGLRGALGIAGLGAREASEASPVQPLSRAGADADFKRLEARLSFSQPLAAHLAARIAASAQTSFGEPLLVSEQFGIASDDGLSTFDSGSLQGDSGAMARGELSSPWAFALGDQRASIAPYAFGAVGILHLERPTALEQADTKVAAYGLGLRFGAVTPATFQSASMSLEWGRRQRDDGAPDGDRFTMTAAIQF
jgi:hemolysin activation/secretion protein